MKHANQKADTVHHPESFQWYEGGMYFHFPVIRFVPETWIMGTGVSVILQQMPQIDAEHLW
jgi:hypothetical protein